MEPYEIPEATIYVYILGSSSGVLYIGSTTNLLRRMWEHKNKVVEGSFSARYNIFKLLYFEVFEDHAEGINREYQLKKWSRKKKFFLIDRENPLHFDLAEHWFD